MPSSRDRQVYLHDLAADLAKAVLETAETLAGKPIELRGPVGGQYFLAPSNQLATICRRWLRGGLVGIVTRPIS